MGGGKLTPSSKVAGHDGNRDFALRHVIFWIVRGFLEGNEGGGFIIVDVGWWRRRRRHVEGFCLKSYVLQLRTSPSVHRSRDHY